MNRQCEYVVLHHTGFGEPHYDFMVAIDDAGPLLTWRSPCWPIDDPARLQPLPDHRRAYLTYEGAVSNGRGEVRRIEAGTLAIHELTDAFVTLTSHEQRMTISRR